MQVDLIVRLVVAGACGALIGFERKSRSKEAGLRTHFVVSIGSALMMIVSKYAFMDIVNGHSIVLDPSRIAAQVVSGIGFLGAGTILVQRQSIKGLTTAAGLWSTAGIGLAIGAGMYTVGFGATCLVLIGLEVLDRGVRQLMRDPRTLSIRVTDLQLIDTLTSALHDAGHRVNQFQIHAVWSEDEGKRSFEVTAKLPRKSDTGAILTIVSEFQGISHARVS